jgi:hypothetical protein
VDIIPYEHRDLYAKLGDDGSAEYFLSMRALKFDVAPCVFDKLIVSKDGGLVFDSLEAFKSFAYEYQNARGPRREYSR